MALDPRYITDFTLEPMFIDKTTGLPLANGTVTFYQDNNRTVLKQIYELTGAPPNYTYAPLPNPISLSSVGTFEDNSDNNVAVYAYPYDQFGNIELYYVVVQDQFGNVQLTREAWPNVTAEDNPAGEGTSGFTNQISNPQFIDVLFDTTEPLVLNYSGTNPIEVEIAPDWTLIMSPVGTGNVTIERIPIAGQTLLPTNPPYLMEFVAGSNLSALTLRQRLPIIPSLWSSLIDGTLGYVSASLIIGPVQSATIIYAPSNASQQVLLAASNPTSGQVSWFNNTSQLEPVDNTDVGGVGYIDILVELQAVGTTQISSIQVVPLFNEVEDVYFDQASANRQEDYLSHYYKPQLAYKPIPSYLIGWNFPTNPAQFGESGGPLALGANTSAYCWDQTIVYQSVTNGFTYGSNDLGQFVLTANATGQLALIQYLDVKNNARGILNDRIAVNIRAATNITAGIRATCTLLYTTGSLPDLNSNLSVVQSLNADGSIAATNTGPWNQVSRKLGKATFAVPALVSGNTELVEVNLNGWDMQGVADVSNATFFAIVLGFESMIATQNIAFDSVSVCSGDIATRPAPQSFASSLSDCQAFYYKTFDNGITPVQGSGGGLGYLEYQVIKDDGAMPTPTSAPVFLQLRFPYEMRTVPDITLYNPAVANASIWNFNKTSNAFSSTTINLTSKAVSVYADSTTTWQSNDILGVHLVADARLGLV